MISLVWEPWQVVVPATPERSALRLEARRLPAAGGGRAVIAPPHPLYGGTFHNPVVVDIAEGLARIGISGVAFNWRGTEGSEGSKTDSLESAVSDYLAAFQTLADEAEATGARLFAAGYSFGAATALLAAREDKRIEGVIMLAPPVGMLQSADLEAAPGHLLVVVGSDDEFAPLTALEEKLSVRRDATLEVVPGADHFFHFGGLSEIAGRVAGHVRHW
ncbi:MAG TPA: alpha/beta fold hydrolase [Polyangiales bacterium]|jgi:alpha/beta superfamily hydrolase|nr:alpha/beta fold hydrolase [Polyangiales bacterium]